jgi:hypothetical protein
MESSGTSFRHFGVSLLLLLVKTHPIDRLARQAYSRKRSKATLIEKLLGQHGGLKQAGIGSDEFLGVHLPQYPVSSFTSR